MIVIRSRSSISSTFIARLDWNEDYANPSPSYAQSNETRYSRKPPVTTVSSMGIFVVTRTVDQKTSIVSLEALAWYKSTGSSTIMPRIPN